MFCIDWNDDNPIEIVGTYEEDDYTRVDLILTPCNYLHTALDYQEDSISSECIGDLEGQIDYMRASQVILYHNQERINANEYGDKMIERYS